MDKRSLLAITLITIIVMIWLWYSSVHTQYPEAELQSARQETSEQPVTRDSDIIPENSDVAQPNNLINVDSVINSQKYGSIFAPFTKGYQEIVTIETEKVIAKISRKGGSLISWELKDYKQWNGNQSQLIWNSDMEKKGELYMTFVTKGAKRIDTRDLYFNLNHGGKYNYSLYGDDSLRITAKLEIMPGRYILKSYTFFGDKYHVNTEVVFNNLENVITTRGYNYVWSDGLKYQEKNSVDESHEAHALISLNDDILELDASDDEPVDESSTGLIDFIGVKTKYFGTAIIPQPYKTFDGTVDLSGHKIHVANEGIVERYDISYRIPYNGGKNTQKFQVYIGPLDYDIIDDYGISKMIYLGWGFIRYIGEYFILPLFMFIHGFIPNFGITIIVFSILMKLLLYPLSIQQMRSAQKMKLLGPEMEKLREKFKDEQQKQQKATMALYSEHGINPAGGCLPMLLQMPILFALWSVLRTSIDLRQTEFIWWITDLSLPDVLVVLPFSLLGIKFLSGLALLMGVTMFLQQKLTITDPRQKAMIYMMPVMFTLIFSNLPSGLNLYYFMFNLISIGLQVYINKYSKSSPTLADLKKAPKKEGWLQKKMREAQDIAESRGKTLPGGKSSTGRSTGHPTKKSPKRRKR